MFDWGCSEASFFVKNPSIVEIMINPSFNKIGIYLELCVGAKLAESQAQCQMLLDYELFSMTWRRMARLRVWPPPPNARIYDAQTNYLNRGSKALVRFVIYKLTEPTYPYIPWVFPNGPVELMDTIFFNGDDCQKAPVGTEHLVVIGDSLTTGYGVKGGNSLWDEATCAIRGMVEMESCRKSWAYHLSKKIGYSLQMVAMSRVGVAQNPKLFGVFPPHNKHTIGHYWNSLVVGNSDYHTTNFGPYQGSDRFLVVLYVGWEDYLNGRAYGPDQEVFKKAFRSLFLKVIKSFKRVGINNIPAKKNNRVRLLVLCGGATHTQDIPCDPIQEVVSEYRIKQGNNTGEELGARDVRFFSIGDEVKMLEPLFTSIDVETYWGCFDTFGEGLHAYIANTIICYALRKFWPHEFAIHCPPTESIPQSTRASNTIQKSPQAFTPWHGGFNYVSNLMGSK
eukprot:Nk52_evm2s123 gene=Nk52_evmTU2s123